MTATTTSAEQILLSQIGTSQAVESPICVMTSCLKTHETKTEYHSQFRQKMLADRGLFQGEPYETKLLQTKVFLFFFPSLCEPHTCFAEATPQCLAPRSKACSDCSQDDDDDEEVVEDEEGGSPQTPHL